MSSMLRSDRMSLYDLYLQPEAAFAIISYLGNMGCVQFLDMNKKVQAFQRSYVSEICRCSEMERKLRYMEEEIRVDGIPMGRMKYKPKPLKPNEMVPLENMLDKWEGEIIEMSANHSNLVKLYSELSEMYYVLNSITPLLGDAEIRNAMLPKQFMSEPDAFKDLHMLGAQLMIVTGVIKRVRSYAFQTMLWRISHGNIYYREAQEDTVFKDHLHVGQGERKVAFLVICQGNALHSRVLKVCSGFRVNLYPCPRTHDDRMAMACDIGVKLDDQNEVLKKTKYTRCKALYTVSRQWQTWKIGVKKAKAVYHCMNMFNLDITRNCLIGRCWVPDRDIPKVKENLKFFSEKQGTAVESFMVKSDAVEKPPTYHRTNKFTYGFQELINAYGESTYRELNPGLYTIITFPFLFAVMFGDIGHGLVLVIFSVWMIMKENKMASRSNNEIFNIAFSGRYVILMLGLFSIAIGFLYNDIFSQAFRLMPPYFINTKTREDIETHEFITLDPAERTGKHAYYFGMDPSWKVATNRITVENSIKMKFAIIIGVIHMLFGLCLAIANDIYFKKYYHIFLVVIPEILILTGLFGWLVVLMYAKWVLYDAKTTDTNRSPTCAPLLLIQLIDLVLYGQTKRKLQEGCTEFFIFGDVQRLIHTALLLIVIVSIPIMLFGSPLYLLRENNAKKMKILGGQRKFRKYRQDKEASEAKLAELRKLDFNFSELMIQQAIHTIEYTLSTVSHTASYLRLWALSLAHAQLSEMLWAMILRDMGLRACLHSESVLSTGKLCITFCMWAAFTIAILIVMEGLSAFLHTLRLHWVEFMSKFFHGNGWMFTPFCFETLLAESGDKLDAFCKGRTKED